MHLLGRPAAAAPRRGGAPRRGAARRRGAAGGRDGVGPAALERRGLPVQPAGGVGLAAEDASEDPAPPARRLGRGERRLLGTAVVGVAAGRKLERTGHLEASAQGATGSEERIRFRGLHERLRGMPCAAGTLAWRRPAWKSAKTGGGATPSNARSEANMRGPPSEMT
ncbi:unnamed protein product [Prorocentrum cordatum]|uniref:Uncharacterized protein n=1 Tax=Prorocentrum cordatum TaxID=2364126 RepID=A0ABN9TVN8_9DINO|nr:unnamed protein product [Polarella glacialis]